MLWVGLQMICIGCLLVQTASVCHSQTEGLNQTDKLYSKLGEKYGLAKELPERTCAEAAKEMRGDEESRALSPWRYRVDQDPDRVPDKISIAECLCEGCIVNGKEDYSYNSKPLEVNMLVYKKTTCQRDANRYRLTRALIKVAVGCVCVMPDVKKQ